MQRGATTVRISEHERRSALLGLRMRCTPASAISLPFTGAPRILTNQSAGLASDGRDKPTVIRKWADAEKPDQGGKINDRSIV
ncbi:uncharacterized [Tachysurus ichikawai]